MLPYIFHTYLYRLTNNILSTAQQVWLQKLGGAKNPMKQFGDKIIEEDRPQVSKSVSEFTLTQKDTRQGEKLTKEGLRPGARLTNCSSLSFLRALCSSNILF